MSSYTQQQTQEPAEMLVSEAGIDPMEAVESSCNPAESPEPQIFPQPETQAESATPVMIRQPETRPVSQERLEAEVADIYASVGMVESKCIEVNNSQSQNFSRAFSNAQWQALITLHRTVLHEHHDYFLASQHPSASPALRQLPSEYAMLARMWIYGIHSLLELLRHRLPASLEHMLRFIYLGYSMVAVLYETVPDLAHIWIECLGDLARYRMAVEDEDPHDREVWTGVSRRWYSMASDGAPAVGRLYHHLAILARPNVLQQLFYYCKSLCVGVPFKATKASILTLFEPALDPARRPPIGASGSNLAFVRIIGVLFTRSHTGMLDPNIDEWTEGLDAHIAKSEGQWQEDGYYVAITLFASVLGFCLDEKDNRPGNDFLSNIQESDQPSNKTSSDLESKKLGLDSTAAFSKAVRILSGALDVILRRSEDANILHFVHCFLVFVLRVAERPMALDKLAPFLQWELMAHLLNTLCLERPDLDMSRCDAVAIRARKEMSPYPLPEDYAMRGLVYTQGYYPADFFPESVDDEDKYFEAPCMMEYRKDRILYLGCDIARKSALLYYDKYSRMSAAGAQGCIEDINPNFDTDGEPIPTPSEDQDMED
ncbi:hypothetical protein MKZ38_005482 [Zalerion maritima]|uniref:DNA/RNA-binding domain-containing protein n=1 Tax=Zalerion maritima TaxID=339359 RepID=A0AAD5RK08_9PEZI|nr:hypothetical protein MKZ38_005482 [Zalerion maritima]